MSDIMRQQNKNVAVSGRLYLQYDRDMFYKKNMTLKGCYQPTDDNQQKTYLPVELMRFG